MTKRLALTPAVGLFAGLSVVSYGAVSMMLTGVHGTRQASSNPCASAAPASPTPTPSTKALIRPAAYTGARAQHPAGMPVLLAYAVQLSKHTGTQAPAGQAAQGNQAAGSASASQTQTVSQSSAPLPSSQPSPSASPPPLPQPSPGSSAGPAPGGLPQPAPAKSSAKQLTPGGTLKSPISTPTATPTPTSTPTPTTTPTTSPPPGTLCLKMQTLDGVSAVDPGTNVRYAIFVWLSSGSGTAKVTLSAKPKSLSPAFSVCATSGTSKCSVSITTGQSELQATLAAPNRPTKRFIVTATATSSQASNSATASATVDIKPKNPSPSSSPTPNAGDGGTLPLAAGLPSGTTIPGVGVQPSGDLGSAFPQVSPSPAASASAASLHGHETRTIDLSAGLPLDVRLIGGQIIGLAVLAAAVTIAVARLSLRRQPAKHSEDSSGS
jgi:hypothetical protein